MASWGARRGREEEKPPAAPEGERAVAHPRPRSEVKPRGERKRVFSPLLFGPRPSFQFLPARSEVGG